MALNLFADLTPECVLACGHAAAGFSYKVFLDKGDIEAAARELYEAKYFIEDISVVDVLEGLEVHYHFGHFENPRRIAVRVLAGHDTPEVPSIAGIFQGAEWHERESMDFLPVKFTGNPNPVPLLLPDDMAGECPLAKTEETRKSYLDMMGPFTFESGADDHPLKKLEADRIQAAKEAAEKAEAERKAAEEAAKKAAEEKAAEEAAKAAEGNEAEA